MARKLNAAQRKILKNVPKETMFYSDLSFEVQDKLDKINCFEDLETAVERYLWDKSMDERYDK